MASPARSAFKQLSLLAAVALSIHCQLKDTGLSATAGKPAAGTGGQAGSTGAPADGAATATGGKGAGGGSPAGLDAWPELDGPAASGIGGGLGGSSGTVVASGGVPALDGPRAQPDDAPAQTGGASGLGGMDAETPLGVGGTLGTGGTTGLTTEQDGTLDADLGDSVTDDVPEQVDAPASGDVGVDRQPSADLAIDLGHDASGTEVADARPADTAPYQRDSAPEAVIDTRPPMTLQWSDDFEGAANTGVDTSKWTAVNWPAGQVNSEKQRYTDSTQNVHLDGSGNLVIHALKSGMEYTSGRLETKGTFFFKTGRIEVRAKLPTGRGSFPGIVLMGTSGGWPGCGEIGVMEQYGLDKSWYYASAYADSSPNSGDKRKVRYDFPDDAPASEFHVYSADWYSDHLVIQVDDQEVLRTSFDTSSPFATTAEYIILDLAIGGDMGGTVDPAGFPMDMLVDYVRVYGF